jgi:hypothetical protein
MVCQPANQLFFSVPALRDNNRKIRTSKEHAEVLSETVSAAPGHEPKQHLLIGAYAWACPLDHNGFDAEALCSGTCFLSHCTLRCITARRHHNWAFLLS